LEDSQPDVMITQPALQQVVSSFSKHILVMGTPALAALFDSPGGKIIPVDSAKKVRKMHYG